MQWTDEDRTRLLAFRKDIDNDNIRVKEKIKKVLLDNKYIIHALHNEELEENEAEPDEYFNVNILPYYIIKPTQHKVQNFVCYTVGYEPTSRYDTSTTTKKLTIQFVVLCEWSDIVDEETSLARHDLLAALIQDTFNFTNIFRERIVLVSDLESVVDNDYACRTLTFRQSTDNNLVKTEGNLASIINKKMNPGGYR